MSISSSRPRLGRRVKMEATRNTYWPILLPTSCSSRRKVLRLLLIHCVVIRCRRGCSVVAEDEVSVEACAKWRSCDKSCAKTPSFCATVPPKSCLLGRELPF